MRSQVQVLAGPPQPLDQRKRCRVLTWAAALTATLVMLRVGVAVRAVAAQDLLLGSLLGHPRGLRGRGLKTLLGVGVTTLLVGPPRQGDAAPQVSPRRSG